MKQFPPRSPVYHIVSMFLLGIILVTSTGVATTSPAGAGAPLLQPTMLPTATPCPTPTQIGAATPTATPTESVNECDGFVNRTPTPTPSATSTASPTATKTGMPTATPSTTPTRVPTTPCGYLSGITEWIGTFTLEYSKTARGLANGTDTTAWVEHSTSATVKYYRSHPDRFPTSWHDKQVTGSSNIGSGYVEHVRNGLSGTLTANGDVQNLMHPSSSFRQQSFFNIRGDKCEYNFLVILNVKGVSTEFKITSETASVSAFGVDPLPLPTSGFILAGSRPVQVVTTQIDQSTGFRGSGWFNKLEEIVGKGNLGNANLSWTITPSRYGCEPTLELDRELLERSVFLDQVSVNDQFEALIDWCDARQGYVTWKLGPTVERIGQIADPKVGKDVNVGTQGVGAKPLTVQAQNNLNQTSRPSTAQIVVANVMEWCGKISDILGIKMGHSVQYRCSFKWPEPAFEAKVKKVPDWIPFFGGKPLGIKETQGGVDLEVKSTGEGSIKGGGQSGFEAMGGAAVIAVGVKGDVKLDSAGVHIPNGALEITVGGKWSKEETLYKLVPTIAAAIESVRTIAPTAADVLERTAKAIAELEVKVGPIFSFQTNGNKLEWTDVDGMIALGIKGTVNIQIVEDRLQLSAFVGGEGGVTFTIRPQLGYKQADVKFVGGYKLILWKYLYEGEKAWNWSTASLASTEPGHTLRNPYRDAGELVEPAATGWQIMDRGYLQATDYAKWTGGQLAANVSTDQQLVQNVYPLANPDFVVAPGGGEEHLIWTHDTPNSQPLGGDELMFARGATTDWSTSATQLTNDDVSDLNPQMVRLPSGRLLALWERFDTANPGDINADMPAFFSHMQIAAGTFSAGTPLLTPLQLSTGNTLNHRPHLGVVDADASAQDGALAVWINNPSNQLMGSVAHPDTIMWSRYTGSSPGTWTTPVAAVPPIAGLRDLDLATVGDQAALVWSQDIDGDSKTDADQELFYALWQNGTWSAPVRLTTNDIADGNPQLVLSATGTPLLVWQQGATHQFLRDGWNIAPVALPFPIQEGQANWELQRGNDGSLALTWQEPEGYGTGIGYTLYDGKTKSWSDARAHLAPASTHTPSGGNGIINNVTPALVTGEGGKDVLALAYQLGTVETATRTVEGVEVPGVPRVGAQHLRVAHVLLGTNLRITSNDLRATPATAKPGEPVTLSAVVHNTGERSIQGGTAELVRKPLKGYEEVIATQPFGVVNAGGTVTVNFPLTRPDKGDHQYIVRIEADSSVWESDRDDNEALLGTELSITTLPTLYELPGGASVEAQLGLRGAIPPAGAISATLTLGSPEGKPVGEARWAMPLTPTDTITTRAWVKSSDVGPGRHQIYWNVDPFATQGETNRDDNVAATSIVVLPDLATGPELVEFGRESGATAPFRMVVRNTGNWASTANMVEVFDGPPGQASTHSLGRFTVPALEAGALADVSGTLNLAGLPVAATGLETSGIHVLLDPDRTLEEIDENNNTRMVGGILGGPVSGSQPTSWKLYLPLLHR